MRGDGAIILDILNLIGRFFKFGMETKRLLTDGLLVRPGSQSFHPLARACAEMFSGCAHICASSPAETDDNFALMALSTFVQPVLVTPRVEGSRRRERR